MPCAVQGRSPSCPRKIFSLPLQTPGLLVRPAGWEAGQQDTSPRREGWLTVVQAAAATLPLASSPTPPPILSQPQRLRASIATSIDGAFGPSTGHSFCTFAEERILKETDTSLWEEGCRWTGSRDEFSFSPEVPKPSAEESILDLLSVGSHLEVSPVDCPSPGIGPCLFPLVLSPANLCVTIASGQPPAWLCSPLARGSTADESYVPHTGKQGGFPREDSPVQKHRGRYCVYSPQG